MADKQQIDVAEVTRLIEALERDLGKVKGDSEEVRRLRQEVGALKAAVSNVPHEHHRIRDALHGLHSRFDRIVDEAVLEGLEISRYVNAIARMLGLG